MMKANLITIKTENQVSEEYLAADGHNLLYRGLNTNLNQ